MRKHLAAALCVLALTAAPSAAQNSAWSYAYVNGEAAATQRDAEGRVTATLACRPPDGDIVLTDFTFGRAARRATSAAVRIGNLSVTVPATVAGRGRNLQVLVRLPQSPPILAGMQPSDVLSVTVNNVTHTYLAGSAARLGEVAYACWARGT